MESVSRPEFALREVRINLEGPNGGENASLDAATAATRTMATFLEKNMVAMKQKLVLISDVEPLVLLHMRLRGLVLWPISELDDF